MNRREFLAGVGVAAAAAATVSSAADASEMKTSNAPFVIPKTRRAWDAKRAGIRATLWQLLGELPPLVTPKVKVLGREARDGYALERFEFQNGLGARVPGYVLIPDGHKGRGPAILYNHWHGGQYHLGKDEMFQEGPPGVKPGEALVRRGNVVLSIDAYCFGDRQTQGPAGEREKGSATESALSKTFLWQGRTLWGMMVRDDQQALSYLASRPEVDPHRIAATGISMGSTRTWWLAALDDRVVASVCVACLTRYQNLIASGYINGHGIYYFVPNVLKHFDTEIIVSLIAPRPLLTLTGDQDNGSPADGAHIINETAGKVFAMYDAPEKFRGEIYKGIGHVYTEEMWQETLKWFERWL